MNLCTRVSVITLLFLIATSHEATSKPSLKKLSLAGCTVTLLSFAGSAWINYAYHEKPRPDIFLSVSDNTEKSSTSNIQKREEKFLALLDDHQERFIPLLTSSGEDVIVYIFDDNIIQTIVAEKIREFVRDEKGVDIEETIDPGLNLKISGFRFVHEENGLFTIYLEGDFWSLKSQIQFSMAELLSGKLMKLNFGPHTESTPGNGELTFEIKSALSYSKETGVFEIPETKGFFSIFIPGKVNELDTLELAQVQTEGVLPIEVKPSTP